MGKQYAYEDSINNDQILGPHLIHFGKNAKNATLIHLHLVFSKKKETPMQYELSTAVQACQYLL